jgi:hypothetical protein
MGIMECGDRPNPGKSNELVISGSISAKGERQMEFQISHTSSQPFFDPQKLDSYEKFIFYILQ